MQKFRTILGLVLVISLVAFASVAVAAVPTPDLPEPLSPAPPPGQSGSFATDGAVLYLQDEYGISNQEARDRLSLQGEAAVFQQLAATAFPATFAGMWWDHAGGGLLRVAFTEAAEESLDTLSASFSTPTRLAPITFPTSLAMLRTLLAQFDVEGDILLQVIPSIRGFYIDPLENALMVFTAHEDVAYAQEIFDERYGPGMTKVVGHANIGENAAVACGYPGAPAEDIRDHCPTPMRGGLGVEKKNVAPYYTSDGICTTGISALSPNGTFSYVLTAGHCSPPGTQHDYYHDGWKIGPASGSKVQGSPSIATAGQVDAMKVLVQDTNPYDGNGGFELSRWVFANNDAQAYQMRERAYLSIVAYTTLCRTGTSTEERCGPAFTGEGRFLTEDGWYKDQIGTGICMRRGDSGGPYYGPINSQGHQDFFGLSTHFIDGPLQDANDDKEPCSAAEGSSGPRVDHIERHLQVTARVYN